LETAKYRDVFVQEANEHIQKMNDLLLKLEASPQSHEYLDGLFRSTHTLKGMAATMRYDHIANICKALEEVFDRLRKEELELSGNLASSLFNSFDLLAEMVRDEAKSFDSGPLRELAGYSGGTPNLEEPHSPDFTTSTIRVKMTDLDALVDMVGELLISKLRLDHALSYTLTYESRQALANLAKIIAELQNQAIKVRLVPLEQIFNRFLRMVRDISKHYGKEIDLTMKGLGIELDRTVLDAINEPLLHVLRNAVDHGIELPDERETLGKRRVGIIHVEAARVGDKVAIQVEDDGKGIDLDGIKLKAVETKILTTEKADSMNNSDILALLGTPGLTSAKRVTDVSGRGVGLNVVRTQVEAIGGYVRIETSKGSGTKITMTIPVSLAIIEGLLVAVGEEKFVIPLSSMTNIIEVNTEEVRSIGGKEFLDLGGQQVSLVRLGDLFKIRSNPPKDKLPIILIQKGGRAYGLVVDSTDRKQQIVVKRVASSLLGSAFSNATILPDGEVVMVLDPLVLLEQLRT